MMNFNNSIFYFINNLAHKSLIMDKLMIVLSKYVPVLFMILVATLYIGGVVANRKKVRELSVDIVAITLINLFLAFVIGIVYYVPRPFVNNKVNLLFPHVIDASFPSDHAIGTMSIALGFNKYKKNLGRILVGLSILVGISRVYVGHHYPLDVLGGYGIVILVNYLYHKFLRNSIQFIYGKFEFIFCEIFSKKAKNCA